MENLKVNFTLNAYVAYQKKIAKILNIDFKKIIYEDCFKYQILSEKQYKIILNKIK